MYSLRKKGRYELDSQVLPFAKRLSIKTPPEAEFWRNLSRKVLVVLMAFQSNLVHSALYFQLQPLEKIYFGDIKISTT